MCVCPNIRNYPKLETVICQKMSDMDGNIRGCPEKICQQWAVEQSRRESVDTRGCLGIKEEMDSEYKGIKVSNFTAI